MFMFGLGPIAVVHNRTDISFSARETEGSTNDEGDLRRAVPVRREGSEMTVEVERCL